MRQGLDFYSNVAYTILNSETQYLSNKEIIFALFKNDSSSNSYDVVKNRITIIDSYYSTQMSKRLYGIDELADSLVIYSDEDLKKESQNFLNNPDADNAIKLLFQKEYGINKSGKSFGKAISLMSKYLYFLNNGGFPIYDSLAIDSYRLLKKNRFIKFNSVITVENYFSNIKRLNLDSGINNYEKLDNLLWLTGKLFKGSFAILMNKEKYKSLVESVDKELESSNSRQKDDVIRDHIRNIYPNSGLFSVNQKTFLILYLV